MKMTVTKLKTTKENEEDPVVTLSVLERVTRSILSEVLDQKLEEQRKTYERYVGALSEEFNDRMDATGEGISMILERLDRDNDENAREHEIFRMKIASLEAKAI